MQSEKIITFYTKYDRMSASVRERFYNYKSILKKKNYKIEVKPLINDKLFYSRIIKGKPNYIFFTIQILKRIINVIFQKKNVVVIQHELLPYLPSFLESYLYYRNIPFIIDIDDAVFHQYDTSKNLIVNFFLKKKFINIFKKSSSVFAGNLYLLKHAKKQGAKKSFIFPTVVNIQSKNFIKKKQFTVVWIGSPSTTKYINDLKIIIKKLSTNHDVNFRIIGSKNCLIYPNKKINFFEWNLKNENRLIAECHLGIMPLKNSLWENGKCGYKLLQYMKHGLPILASPVGVNKQILEHGKNGYFAKNNSEWVKYILKLKKNYKLSKKLGRNGKNKILKDFSKNVYENEYYKKISEIKL